MNNLTFRLFSINLINSEKLSTTGAYKNSQIFTDY